MIHSYSGLSLLLSLLAWRQLCVRAVSISAYVDHCEEIEEEASWNGFAILLVSIFELNRDNFEANYNLPVQPDYTADPATVIDLSSTQLSANTSDIPIFDDIEFNYNLPTLADYLNEPVPVIELLSTQLSANTSDIRTVDDFFTPFLEKHPTGMRTEASFPEDKTEIRSFSQSLESLPFVCNICDRTQKNKKALTKHLRQEHSSSYKCDFPACGAAFGTKDYLQRHERRVHPTAYPSIFYQCPECRQTFKNRKDNLRRHLKDKHGYSWRKADKHGQPFTKARDGVGAWSSSGTDMACVESSQTSKSCEATCCPDMILELEDSPNTLQRPLPSPSETNVAVPSLVSLPQLREESRRIKTRLDDLVPVLADDRFPKLITQPDFSPISQDQLETEVKGIYGGLLMVEAAHPDSKLGPEQWEDLIALHRTLLYDHHDSLMANQHPSATPALRGLAHTYNMPTRMWRHGINAFLEVRRRRRLRSQDDMIAFISQAYQMRAYLFHTDPDTWMQSLDDLTQYRMAVEQDEGTQTTWDGVAARWYNTASNRHPSIGRLYRHLGILERPRGFDIRGYLDLYRSQRRRLP